MFLCLSPGQKKPLLARETNCEKFWTLSGVIRGGEHKSGGRFPLVTMVARQQIHLDFFERDFRNYNFMQKTCIWRPNNAKTHQPSGNRWKSSSLETCFSCGISTCETWIRGSHTSKTCQSTGNKWESSLRLNYSIFVIERITEVSYPLSVQGVVRFEGEDINKDKTSCEWRPRGTPTDG